MSDLVIFEVGLMVTMLVAMSAFIALIASDRPDKPRR